MDFPVVLRFKSMHPNDLSKFEMHGKRQGGDLSHIDEFKTERNQTYVGTANWVEDLKNEINAARKQNLTNEIAALQSKKRKKDAKDRQLEGLKDPWRHSEGGPIREVILTAHSEFFKDPVKAAMFEREGPAFFDHFFSGQVRCLRLDKDEEALHFHAIIVPWTTKVSARRGEQKLIEPSSHPLLKAYECAQDAAGDWFEGIGLKRGQLRSKRMHKQPATFRREVSDALERGIEALEYEEIRLSKTNKKLVFGKNAPPQASERKQISEDISAAYPNILRLAKSIQKLKNDALSALKAQAIQLKRLEKRLRKREETLQKQAEELKKREREIRIQAIALSAAERRLGQPESPGLAEILSARSKKKKTDKAVR
ncbi:hypothetical protein [Shimia sp.]|uniref:hypothetical protein n=1 Tax=Shimia sp. TaxID=1954381 RepID=UPI003B8B1DA0